jgi:hypothetical protein
MKYIKLFENFHLDENFYEWFKGSKIVDKDGNPLIVYHGSPSKFDEFDTYYSGKNWGNTFGRGIYFTNSKDDAKQYTKDYYTGIGQLSLPATKDTITDVNTNNIIEAYLNIKNPLIVSSVKEYRDIITKEKDRMSHKDGRYNHYEAAKMLSKSDNEILMDMGYDGIIYSFNNKISEFICFSNNQIKIINKDVKSKI